MPYTMHVHQLLAPCFSRANRAWAHKSPQSICKSLSRHVKLLHAPRRTRPWANKPYRGHAPKAFPHIDLVTVRALAYYYAYPCAANEDCNSLTILASKHSKGVRRLQEV